MACSTVKLCSFSKPFRHFTYVTAHSPTLPSLYLRHNSFSNSSIASPRSQFILQPFFRFSYVTGSSLTSPGEPPMFNTLSEVKELSGTLCIINDNFVKLTRKGHEIKKLLENEGCTTIHPVFSNNYFIIHDIMQSFISKVGHTIITQTHDNTVLS